MSKNAVQQLKIYELHNRNSGERHYSVATNAQDACSLAGWQIGDCFVTEVKEQRGHSKAGDPPLKVKIPCEVCLYQYTECRKPAREQCPCRPEAPDLTEWYRQARQAHLCQYVGQELKRDDYNLRLKWCPMDEAIRELEHHHLP
ncbi:hypothetical protein ES703_50917 [subsurface metagenome]